MDETMKQSSATGADTFDPPARPFDLLVRDKSAALLRLNDVHLRGRWREMLTATGRQVSTPASAEDALREMRLHVYDMVIVEENMGTSDPAEQELLAYLESLPMSIRRRMFVILVSSRLSTNDKLAAFHHSVNLVLNPRDIDETDRILKSAIQENNAFYHIFKETIVKLGRG